MGILEFRGLRTSTALLSGRYRSFQSQYQLVFNRMFKIKEESTKEYLINALLEIQKCPTFLSTRLRFRQVDLTDRAAGHTSS